MWRRASDRARGHHRLAIRVGVERLEPREVLAVLVVTTALDAGPGSLREALNAANQGPDRDEIRFAIGSGTQRIALRNPLPPISSPVVIDGQTQPAAPGQAGGTPRIVLDGRNAPGASGLVLTGGNSEVKGLAVVAFSASGLLVNGQSGNVVSGNYLGVEADGRTANGNGDGGLFISDSSGNVIRDNVISGNLGQGVLVGGPRASDNLIQGNMIGLDPQGNRDLGNGTYGIQLSDSNASRLINNTVSANRGAGVQILTSSRNLLQGNRIGTDGAGQQPRPNYLDGVFLAVASANTLGGASAGQGNVISGNAKAGIAIYSPSPGQNSAENVIQGNIIGLDATGVDRLGNLGSGILLTDSPGLITDTAGDPVPAFPTLKGNLIGGENAGEGNLISGNGSSGVVLFGSGTSGNVLWGNRIGTDATGETDFGSDGLPLGNLKGGIFVSQASSNLIGGPTDARRNQISGNLGHGIEIFGVLSTQNIIRGNDIGVSASGQTGLGNAEDGINLNSASRNTIGGLSAAEANVIVDNGANGIRLFGGAGKNQILNNRIGLERDGESVFGNLGDGVAIQGSSENEVRNNIISGNRANGVALGNRSAANIVQSNTIGVGADGKGEGNDGNGIQVADSRFNLIGGPRAEDGNLIQSNEGDGIAFVGGTEQIAILNNQIASNQRAGLSIRASRNIFVGLPAIDTVRLPDGFPILPGQTGTAIGNSITGNALSGIDVSVGARETVVGGNRIAGNAGSGVLLGGQSQGTLVAGNSIGLNASGDDPDPNQIGIRISESPANTIGGVTEALRNVVSGNVSAGLVIDGNAAQGNRVLGNRIGTDAAGSKAIANGIGITILGAGRNTIGGSGAGEGNLISGNTFHGIEVSGFDRSRSASEFVGTVIQGNILGPDVTGKKSLSRDGLGQSIGILVNDSPANTIGGTQAGEGNLISGNNDVGLYLASLNASANVVVGNTIGLDRSGAAKLGNAVGVYLNGAPENTIGGSVAGAANVISGNPTAGVYILGELASTRNGTLVLGNAIGTNAAGTKVFGNGTGVYIQDAPRNTIGGSGIGRNLISGNSTAGVYVFQSDDPSNIISGNYIGSDVTGRKNLGNGEYGILLYNAASTTVNRTRSPDNVVLAAQIASFREFTGPVPATASSDVSNLAVPAVPGRKAGRLKIKAKVVRKQTARPHPLPMEQRKAKRAGRA